MLFRSYSAFCVYGRCVRDVEGERVNIDAFYFHTIDADFLIYQLENERYKFGGKLRKNKKKGIDFFSELSIIIFVR